MTCQFLHKTNSVAVNVTGTALVLTFADNPTNVVDMQRFCFCVQQTIPSASLSLPVQLTINGATVPLWDKYGNIAIGSDLYMYSVFKGWYGTDNTTHVIATNIPNVRCGCTNNCMN